MNCNKFSNQINGSRFNIIVLFIISIFIQIMLILYQFEELLECSRLCFSNVFLGIYKQYHPHLLSKNERASITENKSKQNNAKTQ